MEDLDRVKIDGLELQALIGVYDHERHKKQRIIVDVVMGTCLEKASKTDDISNTIDYGAVANRLQELADDCRFQLLEALASQMINMILDEFTPTHVELTVSKPDIIDNAKNVAINMIRRAK